MAREITSTDISNPGLQPGDFCRMALQPGDFYHTALQPGDFCPDPLIPHTSSPSPLIPRTLNLIPRTLYLILFFFCSLLVYPQQGQLAVSRIDQMPDLPMPLVIRDWKAVARNYDNLVFNRNLTGQYLPLSRVGPKGQFNYADNTPLFLDSYVGADDHLNQAEAINILPAIVGATLAGMDKSNQNGMDWVTMSRDFFNLKNGQNVYLNGYSATSGSDWWYDVMPNVYFYQLRSLYPDAAPEFDAQFTAIADRWNGCITKLGGSTAPWTLPDMNYRAFSLSTGLPLATGVPEPESAGSIAWLLYNAYLQTGNKDYFQGAQLALEFLAGRQTNPSYELQLPYGTLAAARMNAIEGTDYPLHKLLDWCFNRGALRGWGSVVGTWGGYDVSGLIGEANDGGNDYAFIMNGFQQAAALAPIPKYDKRYARAIAKWILNVTNASRLFYTNSLPPANQDSYEWASLYDPDACIPHESMKEISGGKAPYATGDAIGGGWAATNLSLYSGSSVGYLAGVVTMTQVPEILRIDLNTTDFYGDNSLASCLYFNPLQDSRQIWVPLPPGISGVYEAITETILLTTASDSFLLEIPASEVRLVRLYPSGKEPAARDGRLYAGSDILDYHYGYDYSVTLTVKALSADHNPIAINSSFKAYCEPGNVKPGDQVQFDWYLDDLLLEGRNQSQVQLVAPATPSQYVLRCRVSANGQTAEDTLHLSVVEHLPIPPVVQGIQSGARFTPAGGFETFTALVFPAEGEILDFAWSTTAGSLYQRTGNSVTWQAPVSPVAATVSLTVTNQDNLFTTVSTGVLVKDTSLPFQSPLIWYPLDSDERNAAADRFHATASGVGPAEDARGLPSRARRFATGQDIIYTVNTGELNFTNAVSLSCWVRCEQFGSERFILSHGSWQQRYKLSVTPEGFLRWTIKTGQGTADLDGSAPIGLNRYYHVCAIYTGYSMELYLDGELDTFRFFSGAILPSDRPFTIGRMDDVETQYAWRGSLDEVKLWDVEIPVKQVDLLKAQWASPEPDSLGDPVARVYPNPAAPGEITIEFTGITAVESIAVYTSGGRNISEYQIRTEKSRLVIALPYAAPGIHVIRIILQNGRVITRKIIIWRQMK